MPMARSASAPYSQMRYWSRCYSFGGRQYKPAGVRKGSTPLVAVSSPCRCLTLDRQVCPAGERPHGQTSGEIRGEIKSRSAGSLPLRSASILVIGGWRLLEA